MEKEKRLAAQWFLSSEKQLELSCDGESINRGPVREYETIFRLSGKGQKDKPQKPQYHNINEVLEGGKDVLPRWLRYGLVFATAAYLAAAIDLYIISLTPFVIAGLAVCAVKKLEGNK